MDYAIMDANTAKLKKKPPLWITRQNVIRELDDITNDYVSQSFSGTSQDYVRRDLRKNKYCYELQFNTSPYWRFSMWNRIWDGQNVKFNDINEKVRCDYYEALYEDNMLYRAQICMVKEFITKNENEERNAMWTAIQHETLLGLYGKISDDILNEILSFC
jgi:hypothetical protein